MALAFWLASFCYSWVLGAQGPIDLGLVPPGTSRVFRFSLSHPAPKPVLFRLQPACGCMKGPREQWVAAGETVEVAYALETHALPMGPFRRSLEIQPEGGASRQLWVTGEVGCRMKPSVEGVRIEGIRRFRGVPVGASLLLEGREGATILPHVGEGLPEFLKAEIFQLGGSLWELHVILHPEGLPVGELVGTHPMRILDARHGEELTIPVTWIRKPPLACTPSPLLLAGRPGEAFRTGVLLQRGDPDVRVRAVKADHGALSLDLSRDGTRLWIAGRFPKEGVLSGEIALSLSDPDEPEALLRYLIKGKP